MSHHIPKVFVRFLGANEQVLRSRDKANIKSLRVTSCGKHPTTSPTLQQMIPIVVRMCWKFGFLDVTRVRCSVYIIYERLTMLQT